MKENTRHIDPEEIARQGDFCHQVAALFAGRAVPPLARVETYGCQQNEADSQRLMGYLAAMGYGFTDCRENADLILLNTCAVRGHAEDRVLGNVGALTHTKEGHPGQVICLCGCMMQEPQVAAKIKESYRHVDLVFGPHALWQFPELLYTRLTRKGRVFSCADEAGSIAEGIPTRRTDPHKAWVSVMYGCNNFCSYCIVPYVRGRERSRTPEDILDEVKTLAAAGYREINLLGQNVNSYGKDLDCGVNFAQLLERVNAVPGEFLIRFMTSHPKDASLELFDTMARCEKVAPHLHLPFQAGSSRVLSAMNRGYTRAGYLQLVAELRKRIPQIVLTSDVIVGFPGETAAEFEETLSLLTAVEFDALYTFIFSPREGTPAAELPDPMPPAEKSRNFQRLLDVQNEISRKKQEAYVGQTLRCLIDGTSEDPRNNLDARTAGGKLVHLTGDPSLVGQYRQIHIDCASTWALMGTLT